VTAATAAIFSVESILQSKRSEPAEIEKIQTQRKRTREFFISHALGDDDIEYIKR
jgi:hypothetical protein